MQLETGYLRVARETIRVPIDEPFVQLGVMVCLAVLAYPESAESRRRFLAAYKALMVKAAIGHGYSRKLYLPQFRGMPNQAINGILRRGAARIVWRLRAAELLRMRIIGSCALPFLREALSAITARNTKLTIRFGDFEMLDEPSFNRLADWVAREINASRSIRHGGLDKSHVKSRVWGSCRPVLHLSWALLPRWLDCEKRLARSEFIDLVQQPNWLQPALLHAEAMRIVLSTSEEFRRFGIREDQTISLLAERP